MFVHAYHQFIGLYSKLDSAFSCLPPEPRFISASPADGEELAVNGLVVLSYSATPFVSYREL